MKNILISIVLLMSAICSAGEGILKHSLNNSTAFYGDRWMQLELKGQIIPTNSQIVVQLRNIGGAASFRWYGQTSSGNISTANLVYKLDAGTTLDSVALNASTPTNDFHSNIFDWVLNNNVSIPSTITGNLIVRW